MSTHAIDKTTLWYLDPIEFLVQVHDPWKGMMNEDPVSLAEKCRDEVGSALGIVIQI